MSIYFLHLQKLSPGGVAILRAANVLLPLLVHHHADSSKDRRTNDSDGNSGLFRPAHATGWVFLGLQITSIGLILAADLSGHSRRRRRRLFVLRSSVIASRRRRRWVWSGIWRRRRRWRVVKCRRRRRSRRRRGDVSRLSPWGRRRRRCRWIRWKDGVCEEDE